MAAFGRKTVTIVMILLLALGAFYVGTAVVSPVHGPIALAILRREAEPGATVAVGDGIEADVVTLPF